MSRRINSLLLSCTLAGMLWLGSACRFDSAPVTGGSAMDSGKAAVGTTANASQESGDRDASIGVASDGDGRRMVSAGRDAATSTRVPGLMIGQPEAAGTVGRDAAGASEMDSVGAGHGAADHDQAGSLATRGNDAGLAAADGGVPPATGSAGRGGTMAGSEAGRTSGMDASASGRGSSGTVLTFPELIDRLSGTLTDEQKQRFVQAYATGTLTPELLTELFDSVRSANACDGGHAECQALCVQVVNTCNLCKRDLTTFSSLTMMCPTL